MPKAKPRMIRMAKVYLLCLVLGASAFGQVSVTKDCGVQGYPADDTATLQACLDSNPGKHFTFPKVNGAGEFDYKILAPLRVKGREPWLEGEVGSGLGYGGVNIYAPNGGMILEQPDTFVPKVESLCFFGYSPAGSNFNGIEVRAAGSQLINICASSFSGHGVLFNGDVNQGNNSSLSKMLGTNRLNWNKGDGLHIEGHDTQVGIFEGIDAENNSGWGINEQSALGNVFIAPHANGNLGGCYNTKQASVQTGVWINPYCEGDQPKSNYGSSNIVLGGSNLATPGNQTYSAGGWTGWTYELSNPVVGGNIALRLKADSSRLFTFYKGNAEISRLTVTSAGDWSFNGFVFAKTGLAYLPQKLRFTQVYQSDGSPVIGAPCGSGKDIVWAISPNVGDFVGYRCVGGAWHGFGAIQ